MLIDNFDVDRFEKTDTRFVIWLDEKKVQMTEDRRDRSVVAYGFGEFHTTQDFPICGRAMYLHVRNALQGTFDAVPYVDSSVDCLR